MSLKIKSVVALALSAAMLFSTAACGTSEASNSGDSSDSSNATTGYDVSTIKKRLTSWPSWFRPAIW